MRRARLESAGPLGLVLLGLCCAAWWPFRPGFEGPYLARNRAELLPGGSLVLAEPSVVHAEAPWLADARAAERLELELELEASRTEQSGPARILALSRDTRAAHLMVGQEGASLVVRCRRPGGAPDGEPHIEVPGVFLDPGTKRIVVSIAGLQITVAAAGHPAAAALGEGAILPTWSDPYRLSLGDEHTRSRAWTGILHRATLTLEGTEGQARIDLLDPARLERPRRFWQVPERARRALRPEKGEAPWIQLAHFGLFAPLGWVAARSFARPATLRHYAALALLALCASASLELGKLAFEGRHPNLWHAVPDVCGALAGSLLRRSAPRK